MKHVLYTFVFLLLGTGLMFGQSSQQNLPEFNPDVLFADFDYSGMSTAFLLDKAKEPVSFKYFTGRELNDSNYVSPVALSLLYESMQSADTLSSRVWPELGTTNNTNSSILNVVLYRYDRLAEESLNRGGISFRGSRFRRENRDASAFVTDTLFAFAPSTILFTSGSGAVSFNLNQLAYSNIQNYQFQLDAGDGTGYHSITENCGYQASYSSTGLKELKLTASNGNEDLVSHSYIFIASVPTSPSGGSSSEFQTESITETYNGQTVEATVEYHYHDTTNVPRKPFFYVEGFDPFSLVSIIEPKRVSSNGYNSLTEIDSLLCNIVPNRDIIYVNWCNSEADIKANAALLKKIIRTINGRKAAAGSTDENYLMAHSMGGLIARLALTSMERSGETHDVSFFISQDVPHLGVHIPVGAQFAVRSLLYYLDNTVGYVIDRAGNNFYSNLKGALLKYFDGTSAKQMLYDYVETNNNTVTHSYHDAFMEELQAAGFPKGSAQRPTMNLAIVNGGPTHIADTLLTHSNHYLNANAGILPLIPSLITGVLSSNLDLDKSFNLLYYLPGASYLQYGLQVNGDRASSGEKMRFQGTYIKNCLFTFYHTLVESVRTAGGSIQYLEEAPGSVFGISFEASSLSNINGLYWLGSIGLNVSNVPSIMFVPTESALCAVSPNYSRNAYITPLEPIRDTPFDAYIVSNEAKDHSAWLGDINSWLNTELNGPVIQGDTVAVTGSTYTLSAPLLDGVSGTWSTSKPCYATINQSGVLTVTRSGSIDILYSYYANGMYYRIKKRVVAHAAANLTDVHVYLDNFVNNGNICVMPCPVGESDLITWEDILDDNNLRENIYVRWKAWKDWGVLQTLEEGYIDDLLGIDEIFPEVSIMPLLRDARYNIYVYLELRDVISNNYISASKIMTVSELNAMLWPRSILVTPEGYFWVTTDTLIPFDIDGSMRVDAPSGAVSISLTDESGITIGTIGKDRDDDKFDLMSSGLIEGYLDAIRTESDGFNYIKIVTKGSDNASLEEKILPVVHKTL